MRKMRKGMARDSKVEREPGKISARKRVRVLGENCCQGVLCKYNAVDGPRRTTAPSCNIFEVNLSELSACAQKQDY